MTFSEFCILPVAYMFFFIQIYISKVDYTKLRSLWITFLIAEVAWHERRRAWVGDISQRSPRLQSISIREKILRYATFRITKCLKIYWQRKSNHYSLVYWLLCWNYVDEILENIKFTRES